MHYDRLKARVLAAVRSAPSGVALVYPDGEGAWIAQYSPAAIHRYTDALHRML